MYNHACIAVATLIVAGLAFPAEAHDPGKVYGPGKAPVDSGAAAVFQALGDNAPGEFSNTSSPALSFVSKRGKFIMGAGGYIKVTAGLDMGHPVDSPDEFSTSAIPMQHMEGNGAKFNVSAMQSQIYLNFVALPATDNQVGGFISANFLNDYTPVLQFAYLRYRGFQAGYDYTLFSDPDAGAPTIDFTGPNAFTAITTTGLRYGVEFGTDKKWKFSVGAELPNVSLTAVPRKSKAVSQRVPDIPVALKYSWGNGDSWIRMSGLLRNLYYRDELTAKNVDKIGYGIQLSGSMKLAAPLTFYYQGVWGKGIANYIQDLEGGNMDLAPSSDGTTLNTVPVWGAYGGLQWNITDRLNCSATYSHVRTYADNYSVGDINRDSQYRYAQYVVANIYYNINQYLQAGAEYIWGRRVNYNGMKCADNRAQVCLQFSF